MNARVFLIVVLTGLFMAAWNSDQTAEQQFLAQRAEMRAAMAVAQYHDQSTAVSSEVMPASVANSHSVPPAGSMESTFRPEEMAAGSYRAVNEHGVTYEFTVQPESAGSARDFYVADDPNGVRWYYVRIQSVD
jgi:hypothetical protein